MDKAGLRAEDILCMGITNQRNTVCLWDRDTGKPLMRGIVWQDKRTSALLDEEREKPYMLQAVPECGGHYITSTASIVLKWIMENDAGAAAAVREGRALFGTVDTYLVWRLTGGAVHGMSRSNASSLGIYDYKSGDWCRTLIDGAGIPIEIFPRIMDEDGDWGSTTAFGGSIAITGVIGDQQASLFGQNCREAGTAKCTNGTGTFMDVNIGDKFIMPPPGLATMAAWTIGGKTKYLFEGELSVTGSAIQWLRDKLGILTSSQESYELAKSVPDSGGEPKA